MVRNLRRRRDGLGAEVAAMAVGMVLGGSLVFEILSAVLSSSSEAAVWVKQPFVWPVVLGSAVFAGTYLGGAIGIVSVRRWRHKRQRTG